MLKLSQLEWQELQNSSNFREGFLEINLENLSELPTFKRKLLANLLESNTEVLKFYRYSKNNKSYAARQGG